MASPTAAKYELENAAVKALSAYNFFNVTDGEQAPLAGLSALRAIFAARTGDWGYADEQRRYLADWDWARVVLGLVDADVSGANTKAAFQAVITAFNANLSANYKSQDHHVR